MNRKYVFGPVASRRLGLSLGVDLVTPKTCSLDCIYCEAKATTCHTLERKEYVPVDAVIAELDDVLKSSPKLDYITFSGAGEPTLNSRIGDVVAFLKKHYPCYPVCLLTNACSLGDENVQRAIARIDRIIPSLDASNAEEFICINRPAPGLDFERFVSELTDYTHRSSAEIFLELFIVPGVNDSDDSVQRFAEIIRRMRLNGVQLNSLDRPGIAEWLKPAPPETVERFIAALQPFVPVQAVGKFAHAPLDIADAGEVQKRIIAYLRNQAATPDEIAGNLDIPPERIFILLDSLCKFGVIKMELKNGQILCSL